MSQIFFSFFIKSTFFTETFSLPLHLVTICFALFPKIFHTPALTHPKLFSFFLVFRSLGLVPDTLKRANIAPNDGQRISQVLRNHFHIPDQFVMEAVTCFQSHHYVSSEPHLIWIVTDQISFDPHEPNTNFLTNRSYLLKHITRLNNVPHKRSESVLTPI